MSDIRSVGAENSWLIKTVQKKSGEKVQLGLNCNWPLFNTNLTIGPIKICNYISHIQSASGQTWSEFNSISQSCFFLLFSICAWNRSDCEALAFKINATIDIATVGIDMSTKLDNWHNTGVGSSKNLKKKTGFLMYNGVIIIITIYDESRS